GLLPFAPGSDGGGSVRIPAAATGLVGIKPSRGLVPSGTGIDGLGGLAVPGPLARTVADAAMLLDAMMQGEQPFTLRSERAWRASLEEYALASDSTKLTIGVVTTSPWSASVDIEVEPEALAAVETAVRELEGRGHRVRNTDPQWPGTYAEHFTTVWQSGAALIPADGDELQLLEPLTRWLIDEGRRTSAPALAAALRGFADFERSTIAQLREFDAVITPALAQSPRPIGWYSSDPVRNFEQQVQLTPFTSFVNVAGLPAIVVPVAESAAGLPIAIHLIGRPGGEATLVGLAAQLESTFRGGDRHPPVWFD
ncbi:MAG TPA: amidase, partial [Terrimesophilobacter sp.]|nr:amidase [Terrimesophilobacter sp.]